MLSCMHAQVLLPVFMSSMRRAQTRLSRRLVIMAMDAAALQACRKQHPYCLPWFQRTCATLPVHVNAPDVVHVPLTMVHQ